MTACLRASLHLTSREWRSSARRQRAARRDVWLQLPRGAAPAGLGFRRLTRSGACTRHPMAAVPVASAACRPQGVPLPCLGAPQHPRPVLRARRERHEHGRQRRRHGHVGPHGAAARHWWQCQHVRSQQGGDALRLLSSSRDCSVKVLRTGGLVYGGDSPLDSCSLPHPLPAVPS